MRCNLQNAIWKACQMIYGMVLFCFSNNNIGLETASLGNHIRSSFVPRNEYTSLSLPHRLASSEYFPGRPA